MQRRSFLSALSAGALTATAPWAIPAAQAAAPKALTPLKFTLDFRVTSQTAPFFLAQSKGYYAQEGLDVAIDVGSGSVASITRVASGAYDLGLGDISALIEAHAQPEPLPVQAVYQYYNRAPFVIIGRKDRGVGSDFASLKGKKVAAAAVESTRRSWPMVAEAKQLGPDLFQWVTTDFSARDNVVVRGDVDAATYFHDSAVSLFARMPQDQLSVLAYADAGVHLYGNAVLASTKLMQERPEVISAFLRATTRALRETLAAPEAALAAIQAREPMLNKATEQARWAITRQYLATPEVQTVGLGGLKDEVLQRQIAQVGQTFALKKLPTVAQVWNPRFLPAAAERKLGA